MCLHCVPFLWPMIALKAAKSWQYCRLCVCQILFLCRHWYVLPFHPAIISTRSRERLFSSRSGAHHWEDEKLPTEPTTSGPQKATMSSYLSFLSHFTQEEKRRGFVDAVCHGILSPLDTCPCNLGPAEWRGLWVYFLMSLCLACKTVTQTAGQAQVLGPTPVGASVLIVRWMQVVDYSSDPSAFNCIWKGHLNWRWWPTFWRLNWLSTPNKANLDECIALCQTQALVSGSCPCSLESHCFSPPEPFKQIKALTKPKEAPGMRKHRNYPLFWIPTQKDK